MKICNFSKSNRILKPINRYARHSLYDDIEARLDKSPLPDYEKNYVLRLLIHKIEGDINDCMQNKRQEEINGQGKTFP